MSVFVDTGVFYAHHDRDAARHGAAVDAMDALLDGEFGHPYTSDYVFDETVTLTRRRTGSFAAADAIARRMRGDDSYPDVFTMLTVGPSDVADALELFRRYDDHELSFTGASTVALADTHAIDAVLSFDDDFDGLLDRHDPARL